MAIVKMINSPRSQNIRGLHGTLVYCMRDAKTNQGGYKLITGINCVPQVALQEFMNTKRLHKQNNGRMYYHMVQSFSPEENITPEIAHDIACRLAETIPGFEIVVATHRDAHHVHSHFVINSVSFETGKKYHSDPQSLQALWDASDKLCLQYGFSVIQKKKDKEHKMNDREYRAYDRGDSWKMELELSIDECMTLARNREHFMQLMEWRGYSVAWTDTRKNITYTTPQGYKCRDRKLNGRKYLKEEMDYEFEQRAQICRRYAGETKTEYCAGDCGATHRRRNGTELESNDLVAGAAGTNPGADPGVSGFAGNGRKDHRADAGSNQFSNGVSERFRGGNAGVSGASDEGGDRCGEADADRNKSDRSAFWRSEREIFERNLRAEVADAQVDDPVPADQSHSQRSTDHPVVDAAYLTANLWDIFNDDDEVEDCTTMNRRGCHGPTLHM